MSTRLLGLAVTLIGTAFSVAGFHSHAAGVMEGIALGIGLMLMITRATDGNADA